jgi:hypothetical protein
MAGWTFEQGHIPPANPAGMGFSVTTGMKKPKPFATEVELCVAFLVTLPKGWVAVMRASDQPARTIVG